MSYRSEIRNFTYICAILLVLMTSVITISCRPNGEPPAAKIIDEREEGYEDLSANDYRRVKPCIYNLTTMELCMRCAKVTKSPIVYPMCCSDEDNVYTWCTDYVYYGRQ